MTEEVINVPIIGSAAADTIAFTSANTTVEAGDGINTITGGSGNNLIITGSGADTITLASGNNTIQAGGGINTITALSGNNHIAAGDGADTITLQSGNNTIDAGGGINTISVMGGKNNITTGESADTITLTSGNNTIDAGGGINTIAATTGDNHITTGNGADTITVSTGDNTIHAGGGANTITASSGENTISAGDGADTISAGDGRNTINSGGGANVISTGTGDDMITAGDGVDTISAGDGNNVIDAGNGANTVTTGVGNDIVFSGLGIDTITTGAGDDRIHINGGADTVTAGAGADTLIADFSSATGAITMSAPTGTLAAGYTGNIAGAGIVTYSGIEAFDITSGVFDDVIKTGDGADVVRSGAGSDTVSLGGGDDEAIYSMAANTGASDVYQGGAGVDTLTLELAEAEWLSTEVQDDIAAFLQFVTDNTDDATGFSSSDTFQFEAFNLTASGFGKLNVTVDGVALDLINDMAPVITSVATVTIDENSTAVVQVTASDVDTVGTLSYALLPGEDAALFTIDAVTGELSFIDAPDFEAFADTGGDNVYDVTFQVSDGIQTDTQAIAVTVTDVDEVNNDYIFVGDGSDIILGDVDGDGDLDGILVTEPSYIYTEDPEDPPGWGSSERVDGPITLLINNGGVQGGIEGAFTSTTIGTTDGYNLAVDFGDFDGDGDLDIVTDNQLLTNDGSANYSSSTLSSLLTSRDIRGHGVADFDGDGDLDMIVGQDGGVDILMINQGGTQGGGEGTFTSSDMVGGNLRTTHIMIGDMDGDGDIDAVRTVFNPYAAGSSTQLLTNDGSGNFTASTIAGVGNRAINVALGDLDSDGDLDMVVSQYGGNDTVHFNNGGLQSGSEGTFSYGGALPTSNSVSWSVSMADLDDDHDLDVFVVSNGDDFVYINDGSGNFDAADTINLGNISGWPAALGDVNGDGEIAAVDDNSLPNINTDGLLPMAYVEGVILNFGDYAGSFFGAPASADGGDGDDVITFGDWAGNYQGSASADVGAGDDTLSFGDWAGSEEGSVMAIGGDGNDTITFGNYAGFYDGSASADGGDGNDMISFQADAGSDGSASAIGGDGNDEITFGENAGSYGGSVSANGGAGADRFIFGAGAANLTIDLGEGDQDQDSVTFEGSVENTTIDNWEVGFDANIDVVDPTAWTAQVVNGNTVLTSDDEQSLTFMDISGLAADDFLM